MAQKAEMKPDDISTICLVGLGYVGYPLAKELAKYYDVIGFDTSSSRLDQLARERSSIRLTSDPLSIREADAIIICVPTPVTKTKEPDLCPIERAACMIGSNLKKGAIVVLESTVYPGLTEEFLVPILEKYSGMNCGQDFKVGYSPERVNPGDNEHGLRQIKKIVVGMDDETTVKLERIYGRVTNTYRVSSIKTAEAAKVIENIQRDLNIALVNELSIILQKLGLDTKEVLDAAATKWNFVRFEPGMVGGHCIPVDPYYLVFKARELGYHPQVILAGRSINDNMPRVVCDVAVRALNESNRVIGKSTILIMGLTYKADVPDTRESPAKELINQFRQYGCTVYGEDPFLTPDIISGFGAIPYNNENVDCIIVAVAHMQFKRLAIENLINRISKNGIIIDLKRILDMRIITDSGLIYRTL